MINPELERWIRGYLSKGYSSEQLANYLVDAGYSSVDVSDTIKSVTEPGRVMKTETPGFRPTKRSGGTHKVLASLIVILIFIILGTLVYFWWGSGGNANANNTSAAPVASYQQEAQPQNTTTNETNLATANCATFSVNLNSCTPYKCNATYSIFGINMSMEYEITGIANGGCSFLEYMPNNGTMYCNNISLSERQTMSQYYSVIFGGGNYSTNSTSTLDGTNSTYTVNGTTYQDPVAAAMNDGKCVITGY